MEAVNETVNISSSSEMEMPAETLVLPLDIPYFISELVVAVLATIGNALTLYVFMVDRKLRRITNYYIASLALADLLVGILAIPFAITVSVGLPKSLWPCLLMISSLIVLCAISIFSLVAVSIDRYWAILHPIAYSRRMTKKVAKKIIWACWFAGTIVGLLPAFGWYKETKYICFFVKVVDYDYLVFFYFCFIIIPGLLMSFFYARIFSVVIERERRCVRSRHGMLRHFNSKEGKANKESDPIETPAVDQGSNPSSSSLASRVRSLLKNARLSFSRKIGRKEEEYEVSNGCNNQIDEDVEEEEECQNTNKTVGKATIPNPQSPKARKKEIRAAQNLSIIILFFFVCWFPINTINCIQAFCPSCPVPLGLLYFTIMLSHANSAVNPLLYAYNMKDFRRSLKVHVFKTLNLKTSKTIMGTSSTSPPTSTVQESTKLTPTTFSKVDPMSLEPCLELSKDDGRFIFPSNDSTQNDDIKKESVMSSVQPDGSKCHIIRKFQSNLRLCSFSSQPTLLDHTEFEKIKRDYHSLEGQSDLLASLLNENFTKPEDYKMENKGRMSERASFKPCSKSSQDRY